MLDINLTKLINNLETIEKTREKDPPHIKCFFKIPDDTIITLIDPEDSENRNLDVSFRTLQSVIGILDSGFKEDYEDQEEFDIICSWLTKMNVLYYKDGYMSLNIFELNILEDFIENFRQVVFNKKISQNSKLYK